MKKFVSVLAISILLLGCATPEGGSAAHVGGMLVKGMVLIPMSNGG